MCAYSVSLMHTHTHTHCTTHTTYHTSHAHHTPHTHAHSHTHTDPALPEVGTEGEGGGTEQPGGDAERAPEPYLH